MKPKSKADAVGALELIEEAIHLLRRAPLGTLLMYYAGAIPFVLGFLYFWSDMSRGAYAEQRCALGALGLTGLFVWMKTWQAFFAVELRGHLSGLPVPPWTWRRAGRIAVVQAVWQPTGFIVLPLALVTAAPFAWAFAFYQNVTVLADGENGDVKHALRRAYGQCTAWPRQNHYVLGVLLAFGFFVFLNVGIGLGSLPGLAKTLLGIESQFTRSPGSLFSTTFFAIMLGLTYLCVDPVCKAAYALRGFYGLARSTGEDLKTELRMAARATTAAALMFLAFLPAPLPGAEPPVAAEPVMAEDLDSAIKDVLARREYNWRLPRESAPEMEAEEKGIIGRFLNSISEALSEAMKAARKLFVGFLDWLERNSAREDASRDLSGGGLEWMTMMRVLFFLLLAAVASVVAVFFYRLWRRRQWRQPVVTAQAVAAQPDLRDENVAADELPEDGWLKLARELMDQGELRLALRALYLASLAHLAHREMIKIAKFKSNHEYEQELRRRTKAMPDLQAAFTNNVTIFDRVWYGMHEVTREALQEFQGNLERIRAC
ncbi:MAG: DUF4129 domain-containing protein [Verrucomicrobiota bacterium]